MDLVIKMETITSKAYRLIEQGYSRKDIVSYMPLNLCDLLTLEDCEDIFQATAELLENDPNKNFVLQKIKSKRKFEDDWKYVNAKNWKKIKNQRLIQNNPQFIHPNYEYIISNEGYIILAATESWDLDKRDELCEYYQLEPKDAECMESTLSARRINNEIVIGLIGDDRDHSYWIGFSFSPINVVRALYPSDYDFLSTSGAFK